MGYTTIIIFKGERHGCSFWPVSHVSIHSVTWRKIVTLMWGWSCSEIDIQLYLVIVSTVLGSNEHLTLDLPYTNPLLWNSYTLMWGWSCSEIDIQLCLVIVSTVLGSNEHLTLDLPYTNPLLWNSYFNVRLILFWNWHPAVSCDSEYGPWFKRAFNPRFTLHKSTALK